MAVKKYSKVKFTLRKELIFILVGIAVLFAGIFLLRIDSKKTKFYKEYTKAGATSLVEDHPFVKVSVDELAKKKESGLVYVFYATSTDSTAVSNIATVANLASDSNVKKVYYLDSKFATEGDRKEDVTFDEKLTAIEKKLGLDTYKDKTFNENFEASLDDTVSVWVYNNGELVYVLNQDLIEAEGNWTAALNRAFSFAYDAKNN